MAGKNGAGRGFSRTLEKRLREIEECARRGESVKAYAERTGQSVYAFYEAKRRARQAGVLPPHRRRTYTQGTRSRAPRFTEAVVVPSAPTAPTSAGALAWRLRLPTGAVLESATPLDATALEQLLAELGGAS